MRTNEQGEKIACSKCCVGHRTSKCVDAPEHQDGVQVIHSPGRPGGSKTDPVRAAEQREKKRKSRMRKQMGEEAAFHRRETQNFFRRRAASAPVQGSLAAGYPQLSVPGYQNLGAPVNPHAPGPSLARRSSFPSDPLPVGLPGPVWRSSQQLVYPGMGYRPAPPPLAAPVPSSVLSALDFPLTAPGHAASAVPFGMDGFSDIRVMAPIWVPGPSFPARSLDPGAIVNPLYTGFQDPMPALGHTPLRPVRLASSVPVSQPVLANQFDAIAQNFLASDQVTGFLQVGMMAQADQGAGMMSQAIPEALMEAGDIVPPVASAPVFPPREDTEGADWDGPNNGQIDQPIPAASGGVQSSDSQSPPWSWDFFGPLPDFG
ncbi:hypothetical protein FMUND_14179 [Fusarium mundagurra]|uniref:Copper-fist domain-containing protein n=1 Tax=Fusarium mundagurra TaxID=1567541 RepID=A0A8H6D2U3_9HYPO|nr:hypothetical protein FMUND_14179 [Fusarium mundagurra]